jgi:Fic family protein
MPIDISGTPYYLPGDTGSRAFEETLRNLSERVERLRSQGKLSRATLLHYYGETRFEQIAESNALEGSTLSVGETELAVLKGITISGHDPAFSRDAQALAKALDELTRLAQEDSPTDIEQVRRLHELILGERLGAGVFRTGEVRIRGSRHVPPRTWKEVMDQMEQWQAWSRSQAAAPPLLRATVLHAWLEYIHPFVDGNGRAGRAVTNLELIRAGYPPLIIRRKDRDPYLDALASADQGDLGGFFDIMAGRLEEALRDLERAAELRHGYDRRQEKDPAESSRLDLWKAGVHLLFANIRSHLLERDDLEIETREYDQLSVDDFVDLSEGRPVRLSWVFKIRVSARGERPVERLAWAGVMGSALKSRISEGRPVLRWSEPNPDGYPPWIQMKEGSPGGEEMTLHDDRWLVVRDGRILEHSPSELATRIAEDLLEARPDRRRADRTRSKLPGPP